MYSCLKGSKENAKTQLFIDTLSTFASYTVRHSVSKMWLGEERVYYLLQLPIEQRQGRDANGPKGRNWGRGHGRMLHAGLLSWLTQPAFLHSGPRRALHTVGWSLPCQSSTETLSHRLAVDQSDEGIFSTEIPFSQMTLAFFKLKKKKKNNQANTTFSNSSEVSLCLSAWKSWWLSLRQHNKCLINPVASF